MKFLKIIAFSVVILLMANSDLFSQVKGDELKELIKKQEYIFVAQNALTQRGRTVNLTSEYDLKIGKIEIEAYLPFFGRAFTAPIDPTQGGIKFTSKNFEYKERKGRKSGWDIAIVPKDYREVNSMNLSISDNGYATLSVNSNQRSNISFYGYIIRKPEKKEVESN